MSKFKGGFSGGLENFKMIEGNEEDVVFDSKYFFKKLFSSLLLVLFGIIIILLKKTDFVYITLDLLEGVSFPLYILILNFAIFIFGIFTLIYGIFSSFKIIIYDNKGNKRLINKIDHMF